MIAGCSHTFRRGALQAPRTTNCLTQSSLNTLAQPPVGALVNPGAGLATRVGPCRSQALPCALPTGPLPRLTNITRHALLPAAGVVASRQLHTLGLDYATIDCTTHPWL